MLMRRERMHAESRSHMTKTGKVHTCEFIVTGQVGNGDGENPFSLGRPREAPLCAVSMAHSGHRISQCDASSDNYDRISRTMPWSCMLPSKLKGLGRQIEVHPS